MTWRWIDYAAALKIHALQIASFGGSAGLRDEGLLESAMAKAETLAHYDETVDIADLAAVYGYGIARNHPFIDGNKRTALVVVTVFLDINGYEPTFSEVVAVLTFTSVADGSLSQKKLAAWLRSNIKKRQT